LLNKLEEDFEKYSATITNSKSTNQTNTGSVNNQTNIPETNKPEENNTGTINQ